MENLNPSPKREEAQFFHAQKSRVLRKNVVKKKNKDEIVSKPCPRRKGKREKIITLFETRQGKNTVLILKKEASEQEWMAQNFSPWFPGGKKKKIICANNGSGGGRNVQA